MLLKNPFKHKSFSEVWMYTNKKNHRSGGNLPMDGSGRKTERWGGLVPLLQVSAHKVGETMSVKC